jgi:hydrogenase nickel incorporation protein HypA/HybF
MHEMGIAMQIIEIAVASIPSDLENAEVKKVNIKVGKLSAVVPESLHFCFQIAAQETPLCDAELNIEEIPLKIRCTDCNAEWIAYEPVFLCGKCNGKSVEMLSGRELDITSIEIVDKDN